MLRGYLPPNIKISLECRKRRRQRERERERCGASGSLVVPWTRRQFGVSGLGKAPPFSD